MSEPEILTFGCRLNAFESEVMRRRAAEAGLHDTVIVNTCAVTAEAERQARQAIRRARRANPGRQIIVTGCAAQLEPERFASMPEVDRVIGNREKLDADSYRGEARLAVGVILAARKSAPHLIDGLDGRARAIVQIQQGCDHRCTFCIIPFARGPNRSLPETDVIAQIRTLVDNGYREVVLTGVDITEYGCDWTGDRLLGTLVRRILDEVPDLARLRLSSLDPAEIDPILMSVIAGDERLMPHFHISAQSGSDMILKRMARRHLRSHIIAFCDNVRRGRGDAVFGADLIAGFPTETAAMFADTLGLVADAGLTYLHIFPYSARPGTPAAKMPQVEGTVRKERAAILRRAGAAGLDRFLASRLGRREPVLVETERLGRTEHYAKLRLDRDAMPGRIVAATVYGYGQGALDGRLHA